jgi:hypothetical protein
MDFLAAEFDRLDKDKSGDLDVRDLEQSRLRVKPLLERGKVIPGSHPAPWRQRGMQSTGFIPDALFNVTTAHSGVT